MKFDLYTLLEEPEGRQFTEPQTRQDSPYYSMFEALVDPNPRIDFVKDFYQDITEQGSPFHQHTLKTILDKTKFSRHDRKSLIANTQTGIDIAISRNNHKNKSDYMAINEYLEGSMPWYEKLINSAESFIESQKPKYQALTNFFS